MILTAASHSLSILLMYTGSYGEQPHTHMLGNHVKLHKFPAMQLSTTLGYNSHLHEVCWDGNQSHCIGSAKESSK